ncbi:MAG TPA: hypothetical protein VK809_04960 [Bacteroidia bacterium]|jgi:hypothetical protein|nr:hypothetical protein [Bacteroidia bacterium]
MKKVFSILLVSLLFCATVFSKNIISDTSRHDSLIVRDGSSFKKAVIILDTTESSGVTAEYNWLALHYPGYSSNEQALAIGDDKHPYDILHIITKEGEEKKIYFDISNYFGKW